MKKQRKPNRLKDFNYSVEGWYFVTICTKNQKHWFGKVVDEEMILNELGKIAKRFWEEIPLHIPDVKLDVFIVMPNHIHGIIIINKVGNAYMRSVQISDRSKMLLSKIIQQYKSAVSREIRKDYIKFNWHKSYYDHIIRNEKSLNKIREYVINNPAKWHLDKYNK